MKLLMMLAVAASCIITTTVALDETQQAVKTPSNATSSNEFEYATEYDVIEALNGTPYFETTEEHAFQKYGDRIEVDLNMTSNISDSERASRLVFQALFKNPLVNEVEIECYSYAVYATVPGKMSFQHYVMTRTDAEEVKDWVNLDLWRYDPGKQFIIEALGGIEALEGGQVPSDILAAAGIPVS